MKALLFFMIAMTGLGAVEPCDSTDTRIVLRNVEMVARVTGEPIEPGKIPSPNNTGADYDVYGTDLGFMWPMGGDKVGMFFGDTNGAGFVINKNGGNGKNWRSNVVAFSTDTDLTDGLTIDSMVVDEAGEAEEVCPGGKANPDVYQTSIPTSAIRIGKTDVVHIMNIYNWGGPKGRWLTNYSTLYTSEDDGQTWTRQESVTFDPDSHFSQVAYAKKGGWVYMIGTQSGRGDDAYLARFREKNLLDMTKYEYWNGEKWVRGNESAAAPVIDRSVGEASLMWHKKYKRWILTHNYDPKHAVGERMTRCHAIMYRSSEDLIHWTEPQMIADGFRYPGLYCAFMHPLMDNDDKLWFIMSLWGPYNTFLMSADITLE